MSDQPIDQTTFIESTALRDEEKKPTPSLKKHDEEAPTTPKPGDTVKKPPLPLYIAVGVVTLLLLILAVSGSQTKKRGTKDALPQASQVPGTSSTLPDDLQKAITTLDADIKAADPQNNDLPFPPVNFSLHLKTPVISQ